MHPRLIVYLVTALTVFSGLSALAIMQFGPIPPTPYSEKLFATFDSLFVAGFFALLGLLSGISSTTRKKAVGRSDSGSP